MRPPALLAALTISIAAALGAIAACSADASVASSGTTSGSSGSSDAGTNDGSPFGDAGAVAISANGIVLVHAASFPAFRICFDGTPDEQPIPATDLMPSSNLPGLEVGGAIRLAPRKGPLGRAVVYREETLRPLYFNTPQAGPSCEALLTTGSSIEHIEVATGLPDVSNGVHLLVLQGCANDTIDPTANTTRCGDSWKPTTGNLTLTNIPLTAYSRPTMGGIPVQLVQLSVDLQARARTRLLGLAFGELEAGAPAPFAEGVIPFGKAVPNPPAVIDTRGIELSDFATSGVFVTLGAPIDDAGAPVDAGGDAGPREIVYAQSLADIQRKSSPRALPPDWFATASSYVLLSVGEIDPKNSDGGPGDERRGLHFLAVPLTVEADAGSTPVIGATDVPDAAATD